MTDVTDPQRAFLASLVHKLDNDLEGLVDENTAKLRGILDLFADAGLLHYGFLVLLRLPDQETPGNLMVSVHNKTSCPTPDLLRLSTRMELLNAGVDDDEANALLEPIRLAFERRKKETYDA